MVAIVVGMIMCVVAGVAIGHAVGLSDGIKLASGWRDELLKRKTDHIEFYEKLVDEHKDLLEKAIAQRDAANAKIAEHRAPGLRPDESRDE